ncbi:MAG: TM2 domain-containing protein [Paramuribaculum sp.]|nr:TM2 domain-containing protein [Paramuribaculum sp.]
MRSHKDKTTTILLTFFLGGFGAQWFYLGKYGLGVISLLFCWTYIPGLIALIQFIMLLCMSTDEFNRKYNM